jgi:hypothetical protein
MFVRVAMSFSMGWVPRIGRQEAGVAAERATGSAIRAGVADGAAGLQFRSRLSARVAPVPLLRTGDDGNPHAAARSTRHLPPRRASSTGGSATS